MKIYIKSASNYSNRDRFEREARKYIANDDVESAYDLYYRLWAEYSLRMDDAKKAHDEDEIVNIYNTYMDVMNELEDYLEDAYMNDKERFSEIVDDSVDDGFMHSMFGITHDGDVKRRYMKNLR